jgi:hypothetical protein
MTRHLLTASTAVLLTAATPTFGNSIVPGCGDDVATPPTPYVALRRLEARTERGGRSGWIDVRTTLSRDGRFVYEVLQEGGSEQVREKALIAALDREKDLVARGGAVHMPAILTSYACGDAEPDAGGLMRVAIRPREPSKQLVNGTLLLDPRTGTVLRITGALSKNPSFWVSDVEMDWTYATFAGVVLPTAVQARARVRFVGPSTFSMTYRYLSVGGQPISEGRLAQASTTDRRQ